MNDNFNNNQENFYRDPFEKNTNPEYNFNNSKNKSKKNKVILAAIGGILGCVTLGFSVFGFYTILNSNAKNLPNYFQANNSNADLINPNGPAVNLVDRSDTSGTLTPQEVYKKCSPSIVYIQSIGPESGDNWESFFTNESKVQGAGSGIIISEDGYVATNAHVIFNSKQTQVRLILNDGTECEADIVGFDGNSDVAVLKIKNPPSLTPAEFGNSDQLEIGETVMALGNPLGKDFYNSLTKGIISALKRTLSGGNIRVKNEYIQTDTPINTGNSGGALLDLNGRVIGITTLKLAREGVEGMGFVIPSNKVKLIVDEIIKKGFVPGKPILGVKEPEVISPYQSQRLGVPQGILVKKFIQGNNLEASGIKLYDIITKINDVNAYEIEKFYEELNKFNVGDTVELEIFRITDRSSNRGETFKIKVQLMEEKSEN